MPGKWISVFRSIGNRIFTKFNHSQFINDFELSFLKMLLSKEEIEEIMIGKEDKEEVVLKVTDRRKFNFDGSVREGVEFEKEPPAQKIELPKPNEPEAEPHADERVAGDHEVDETEMPGADDPASFVNFLSTLATNAAASLGAMPHPVTGQRSVDLETGKYWIDVLAMLKEKTQKNLHPQEQALLDGILGDLRMQFVQINRMAEEKLKAQAAQKFSGKDILGRK